MVPALKSCCAILGAITFISSMSFSPASAATPSRESYLAGRALKDAVPPKPDNASNDGLLDLYLVRQAQAQAGPAARNEAYDDAGSYNYNELLPRFSEAAGGDSRLSITTRPILAHMLKWMLADVGYYAQDAKEQQKKAGGGRVRPYAEDEQIRACYTPYLKPDESYPSGHSANGYTAALLLGEVMPSRRGALLDRGARYGDNRVVCGVHHPIDVERGRQIARRYFAVVKDEPAFRKDLACAVEEDGRERARGAGQPVPPFSSNCTAMAAEYSREQVQFEFAQLCSDWPTGAADRPKECAAK